MGLPGAKRDSTWSMTLRIERDAYCPTCGQAMQGPCVFFVGEVAFCEPCAALPDSSQLQVCGVFDADAVADEMVYARGVFFYCPRDRWNRGKSAMELVAQAGEEADRRGGGATARGVDGGARVDLTKGGCVALARSERAGRCGPATTESAAVDGARSA